MALLIKRSNFVHRAATPGIFILISTIFVHINGLPLNSEIDVTNKEPSHPQTKQGILEIPKQAATIIRNFIDKNLETYLQISTPAPNPKAPPELSTSILGHFLLGNFYASPPPAPPYSPAQAMGVVQPVIISNEASFMEHSQLVTKPPTSPPVTSALQEGIDQVGNPTTKRVRTRRTTKTPVHTLDQDPSLNGIYNSYGVLLNTPDEVYWIEDYTRPSVIIPIKEATTTPKPKTTTASELTTVKSATDGEDSEENEDEEEVVRKRNIAYQNS